jgi:signal transduction histidine kinase
MSEPRVTLVDSDPRRAAATADRLACHAGTVTVVPPESRSTRPTDAVVVVRDSASADGHPVGARVRRAHDVPVVVADADEAVACADGASTALLARVRGALCAADRPVPTLAVDDRSRVVCLSDDAAALLGADPTRAVGRPLGAALPRADALHETVADVAATGEARTATVDRDGAHVEAWAVPTATNVDCLLRDVTDRVEREAALRRQRDRLEEFARAVAHDLRNPLTVAIGRLDLLVERNDLDPENDDLAALRAALDRADDLIDDTLRFARESAVDDLEPVSVTDVARAAWSTAPTAAATLDTRPVGQVFADPEALRRLFENLFRNAVEHGSTGSQNAERSDDAVEHARPGVTVTVGSCDHDDLGFFVEDDGPGIPPEDRDRVFDRSFSTADGGLGLAVVRQVATAHGWTVRAVDSAAGGARFEVRGVTAADAAGRTVPDVDERGGRRADGGTER